MAQGLERIPLAVDSDFQAQPVRANFPEAAGTEFKVVAFEPDQAATPPAPQARSLGTVAADTVYGMAKGAGSLAKGIGWLAGSDDLQQAGQDAEDYWGEKQSADLHRQLEAVGKAEGVTGTLAALGNNPGAIGDYIATSLPMMIPGMAVGNLGARGIVAYAGNAARGAALRAGATEAAAMQAGRVAAEKAAEKAAMRFAVGANMLGEGAVSGGVTGAEVEKFALEHGATPEQAKASANKSALMAGAWTTAGAGIGAGMETRAMLGRLKDSGIKGMAKNVAKEAAEEAIQNPGEDYAAYAGKVPYDPTQTFDPGKAATLGAVTGGAMGAGFHAAGRAGTIMRGEGEGDNTDGAIPAGDIGAGPGGGGIDGEFIPAGPAPALANQPGGTTYDQSRPELPAGQTMLPRLALPAPEDGGPSDRQVSTAIGLLKHSPKASPDLLQRLMRVDQTMATMLFNHWQGQTNGQVTGNEAAEIPAQSGQGQGADIAGSRVVDGFSDGAVSFTPDTAADVAAPGGESGVALGAAGPDAVTTLDVQAHAAATSPFNATPQPTEAQKQAGNYKKGKIKFQGMDISIENPAGSVRSGTNQDGKAWENTLQHHYGYIRGTTAKDGDHVDAFIKPGAQSARTAYVIDQIDPKTGKYDEAKVILGADSEADAQAIYHANYEQGWQGMGAITAMPIEQFKDWIKSGKTKKPVAYTEPKEIRTASRSPKTASSLLQAIVNRGGISREIMQDVGADPAGRYMPGLFTKTGTTDLSALASYLFDEDGFHQIRQDSDIGPARELEDLITRALGGEKVLSTTAMEKGMQAEETAKFKEKAQRLGVKTVARKLEDIAADVLRIEAQNVLDEETRLEEELLPAYNETVDALHAAIGEDAAENFLEDLESKYQDETHLNYLRSATADIQEKINEQAISATEKPAEAAGRAAAEGDGTGVAPGGDRTAGEEARPALTLSSQSEAELAARDKAAQTAEAQRLKDEQAAENKRQADAERGSFQLTGSDRPADVLAAQGQGGLFDAPAPSAEVGSPQEEYQSVIDDLSDAEIEALFKKAGLAGAKATIDQKRAMLRAENEADIFPLYEAMMDANEVPGETADRFDSEGPWDIEVANFPEPTRSVNANASAGPVISPEAAAGRLIEWKKEARRIGKEEDHSNEVIFSLFDATGEISKPWREAGYTVLQYDIKLGDDLLEFFPMSDILEVRESGMKVVGVIAQPPCTCFSSSGARWWSERHDKTDRDMVDKMFGYRAARYFSEPKEYTKALVSLVDLLIGETEPEFFAMENPVGRIATEMGLPKPTLIFDPHVYGNPYTKKTQLWGKFNPDLPTANVEPTQGSLMHKLWSRAEKDGGTRSITPEGFAYAFFMANKERKASKLPVAAKTGITTQSRANIVIRDVRDRDGNKLGDIIEPYDGTEDGARMAAERASNRMWDDYQDASNIQSRIGATDEGGNPKWAISPNFAHISPVDTAEGRATFGDEDAIREVYGKPQTSAGAIAGKPVADMSDDQLRTIARGLSPTFGEAAVDKAKTEINRRNAALREATAVRGEVGASLTKEQRKAVMQTLTDVYKTKGAPKESKGLDQNGNERVGYAYSPELFEKSDITGAPIRYVVTLPDGRIAHPTELFPDMTLSKVEALILEQEGKERDKAEQDKFRREQLERRKSDTINEANAKFNRANPGLGLEFVPALLTDGKQFIRSHPDTVANDLRLLGGDWSEKPIGEAVRSIQEPAAAHKVGDKVKLTKPGVNGRINIAGTVTKILPDGRLEVRTQQDGYMTVAESELGHKPKVGAGETAPAASIAGKPVSEMSDGMLDQIAKSSQPAAEKAKAEVDRRATAADGQTAEPGRMNMRHTVPAKDMLTPARAIKAGALKGAGAVWMHQGDPNQIQFNAKVTFAGQPASERAIAEWDRVKKAQELGYRMTNYRAGSYGTVWVLEKDGRVLTKDGFEAVTRPEFDRPVREASGPGYDNMVSGQATYANRLAEWFATLPESTLQSASALATKIGQTPIGEWAKIERERSGLVRFEFITPDNKTDLYNFGGDTYAEQVLHVVALAGEGKQKGDRAWFQVNFAASEKAQEWIKKDMPIREALAEYGFARNEAPAPTQAPSPADRAKEDAQDQARRENPNIKTTLAEHDATVDRLRDGTATLAEYKAAFQRLQNSTEELTAEFAAMKKDDILKHMGGMAASRYRSDTKAQVVTMAVRDLMDDFSIGRGISYTMGGRDAYANAVRAQVERTTDADLAEYAEHVKSMRAAQTERVAQVKAAMSDPKTLDDFEMYLRAKMAEGDLTLGAARMTMTPEQRVAFDELAAEKSRAERKARGDQQRADIRVAAATTEGQIIETKHTKTGEPLFVVKAAERVERDVYNHWNATAKKLGGWYSSYRAAGAVPGFQFKTRENADAFLAFIGGNVEQAKEAVQTRRDAFEDDRSQTAVERLTEMADRLEERADESLNRDRKENTDRRARMAASAEAAANSDKSLAKTMRNIAQAIESGKTKFLDRVRQKAQVEMLRGFLHTAKANELRAKFPNYGDQEKHRSAPPTAETADYVDFPRYTAFRSDLATMGRQMLDIDGAKKTGAALLKVADDVSAAYLAFAKEHLHQVSTFKTSAGKGAIFASRDDAETAIKRSGFKGKAVVLPFKRGQNIIIMSPSAAKEAGIWQGDDDKRITLTPDFGEEVVAKVKEFSSHRISMPYLFESVRAERARLKAIGIETPAELRSALREFMDLRAAPPEVDKIKQMERAMIGRKNDGLDFFPTPASVADELVQAAGIEEGMAVLEPSAGWGHIAERIRAAGVDPDVVEMASDRRELLEAKGFRLVGSDFMDMSPRGFTYGDVFRDKDGVKGIMSGSGGMGSNRVGFYAADVDLHDSDSRREKFLGWRDRDDLEGVEKRAGNNGYDRIIMNPPFSDRRDAEHVRHAYTLLKPGGRLVAIMGEGVFFGQDKKAQAFRDWLDEVGGTSEKLEEGTFLDPSLPVNTGVNARMVVINKAEGSGMESRSGRTREAFAANALQELATEDELFRYPVSQSSTLKGVFHDVFPGVEWHGESTRADEKDASGADQRYTLKTPDTPAKDGRPEVIGKQFEVYVTRDKVWIDVHRSMPGEQGSRIYAAVANFAYNTRRVFRGDPAGVSVDAIKARNKMMLASALRFGTTRHLEASTEQEKGIAPSLPPLDWSGSDIDKVRALIHTFITTVHNNAPDIKHYSYDFAKQKFIDNRTGLEFRPSFAAFDDALGEDQRRAAGIGADSGRAAILIQSLVREEGRGAGDGGILQAILDYASSLVSESGGLKGVFSKATPAQAGVSVSEVSDWISDARAKLKNIPEVEVVQSHTDIPDVGRRLRSAAERYLRDGDRDALDLVNSYEDRPLEGAYIDGKIWLVADSLPTRKRTLEVLAHEAVGHMAVEEMLDAVSPDLMPRLVKQVQLLDGGGNKYIRELGEDVDRTQPGLGKDDRAKEIIAQIAERGDQGKDMAPMVRSLWQKILDGIKAFYRLVFDQTLSDQDVRDIVATAERWAQGEDHVTAEIDGAIKSASIGSAESIENRAGDANNMVPVIAAKVGAGETANRGMESRAAPTNPQGPIWNAPEATWDDDLIYTMQDKNVDLKRVQQGITKALGDIRDDVDAYLQEELFHGRAAKATEEFLERELQPFVGEMKQRGIDMDTLETFLWARHAKERNAQIAKINPDMPDGGSGLTDKQAADILAGRDVTTGGQTVKGVPQAKLRSLGALAAKVDRMVAGNRILTETYELETPDTVAAWKGAYQHYVPLHREDADTPWAGNGTGQGYSVKGSSTKRATGSFRPVENILANLVLQRTRTITRGEKNRVAQALYGLAKESPNEGFWDTDNAPTIRTVENKAIYHVMDGKTEVANFTRMADAEKKARENSAWFVYQDWGDRVVEKIDPAFRSKPNVVWARFGGEDRFVIFNERDERAMRLAGSLKNLDADDISHLLGEVSRWTRYFASINTQYNPVFGVINLIRDTGTGLLNLKSTPLEGKQKELLGNVWQALPAIYKAVRVDRKGGTPTGTWADLWEDFQEAGGKTGYRDMFKNSHEQHEALQMALDPTWWQGKWWGKALTVGGVLSVPEQLLADKIGKPVFEWLSDYNTMMENGIRLSAYKLALDEGMTRQRAASLAKNLTVNFNKKGQVARQAGALYAFFNASVQGTARMAETLHHGAKPGELLGTAGKQIVYGGMMLGAAQAMLLMMAGFDDDEPPEFVRDRNIIIPAGGGKYLTVPLPLGFHVLPAIGRIGTEFVLGGFKKPGKHVAHVFDVLADSFNPIGNAGLSMQTLAPTVLDPAAALAENKDWTGKPIFRENMSGIDQKPGHARTKDTATGLSKGLAYAINAASGGTEFKPGLLSPTPDQIDYLIGQITGGVGRETSKAFQTGSAAITGEDLPTYKIPLVGRFYGDTKGQAAVSGKFYENLKIMNEHQAEFMGLSKSNRGKEAQEYAKENPEAMMFREGDRLQRYISKLRDQKRTMLTKGEPREKIKAVDDQITKTMQGFNQRVDAKKNPQRGMTRAEAAN